MSAGHEVGRAGAALAEDVIDQRGGDAVAADAGVVFVAEEVDVGAALGCRVAAEGVGGGRQAAVEGEDGAAEALAVVGAGAAGAADGRVGGEGVVGQGERPAVAEDAPTQPAAAAGADAEAAEAADVDTRAAAAAAVDTAAADGSRTT